jgi:hypothetical protein
VGFLALYYKLSFALDAVGFAALYFGEVGQLLLGGVGYLD